MIYKIANAMLTFDSISRPKLQKLCYYAYAWYITFFGERLVSQLFMAGEQGPICLELEAKYQEFEQEPIPKIGKKLSEIIPDVELREFLKAIYDAHGELTDEQLETMACMEDPWINARNREGELSCIYVDEEIIEWQTAKVLRELKSENIYSIYNI
ncbi:MAG: hypothetical protein APF84_08410 [Gracilibacter sp. BRH_c7a]|nr:MAG: hypothetical protein APF84_08410 [Gracilibacter sp. BRH_c7a]